MSVGFGRSLLHISDIVTGSEIGPRNRVRADPDGSSQAP